MNDVRPSRRQLLAGLSALALAPALVACGEDSGGESADAAPDAEKSEQGAFPVTLEHKYGSTTLEKAPARVVCVGLTEQDALLALGIVPVGGDQVVRRRAGLHLPVGGAAPRRR